MTTAINYRLDIHIYEKYAFFVGAAVCRFRIHDRLGPECFKVNLLIYIDVRVKIDTRLIGVKEN